MKREVSPYDALLVCSFGGPNAADDVVPFLRNVVRGKGVPDERLEAVGEHYYTFGGKSSINEQNIALRQALADEFARRGIHFPVLWSNRNWHPYTVDTLRDAHAFGARRILVVLTSAYASYSSTRQYREHLAASLDSLGTAGTDLTLDIVRPFFNDPGFIAANIDAIRAAGQELADGLDGAHIAYITHSIPTAMQEASEVTGPGYREQHEDVRAVIDTTLRDEGFDVTSSLSYCSRSGSPSTPWLEPDINDHLVELADAGHKKVVLAPIGFVSDHMEVAWDLDTEAAATARDLGFDVVRSATVGVAEKFIHGLVDLVLERAARERGESPEVHITGALGSFPDEAPPGSHRMRFGEATGIPVIAGTRD